MNNIVIHMLAIIFLIIGGLNWGLVLLNYNLAHDIGLKTHPNVELLIYGIVFASAIYVMFSRDTYLPFLGEMAYPCDSLVSHVPDNADTQISIKVPPKSTIVYWASESAHTALKDLPDPRIAYHKYENTGVVISDENGNAELKFRHPQSYIVPGIMGKTKLDKHVHYRYCIGNGMLSPIYTVFVE
jgi:uncharacterized membrane protein YuzA (DUF378 family)